MWTFLLEKIWKVFLGVFLIDYSYIVRDYSKRYFLQLQ